MPTPPVLSFLPPRPIGTTVHARLPDRFRHGGPSEWGLANRPGHAVDAFLEGPTADGDGTLWLVDIPFGRIFAVGTDGEWTLALQYDGWPNGMKAMPDGTLWVADYRRGLLRIDPRADTIEPLLARRHSESFKGLNDLCVARDGSVYFTDQGQTGLHDPTGRVYRWMPPEGTGGGRLDCLLDNVPSPNGLALDPSQQVLYVAATRDNAVWRVPLMSDGGVAKVGRFCSLFGVGGPDGLAVDAQGRLYVAHVGLGHVFVHSPAGELTHVVRSCAGSATTNLVLLADRMLITESETGTVLAAPLPD